MNAVTNTFITWYLPSYVDWQQHVSDELTETTRLAEEKSAATSAANAARARAWRIVRHTRLTH